MQTQVNRTVVRTPASREETAAVRGIRPSFQAFRILQFGFAALPIIAGADKFLHLLVNWEAYLSPLAARILPISGAAFMRAVGVIEIVAGAIVAVKPRLGGYIVAGWLWAIIANLFFVPGYFDIALRDFGLSLGALALARLAKEFDR